MTILSIEKTTAAILEKFQNISDYRDPEVSLLV